MLSVLASFFSDVNSWIIDNVGEIGVTVLIVMLSILALFILANLVTALGKLKKVKGSFWFQLLLLALIVTLIVWLCITFSAK